MAHPRIIVSGATVAVSRRAVNRKAFLGEWDARVGQAWLYALADAQQECGVAVHHGVRCVNHHHLEVTGEGANLPKFLWRLHRDVSCALNALMLREGYDAPGSVFDGRPPHVMRLVDDGAQMRHLVYSHLNPVAAGLVGRPSEMPGRVLSFEDWLGDGVVVQRPDFYFGDDRPEQVVLRLTPPLELLASFGGDLGRLVYSLRRLVDGGASALRRGMRRAPMGARRVVRIHPWDEPQTRRVGGQRVPSFKVGALGADGVEVRRRCAREVRAFREAYADARRRRWHGEDAAYPHGTYGPRVYANAPVQPQAGPGALLTLEGPATLEEALGRRADGGADRHALVDAVRADLMSQVGRRSDAAGGVSTEAAGTEPGPWEGDAFQDARLPEAPTERVDEPPADASWSAPSRPRPRRLVVLRRCAAVWSGGVGPPR